MRKPNDIPKDNVPPPSSVFDEYGGKRFGMLNDVRVVNIWALEQKAPHKWHFGRSQTDPVISISSFNVNRRKEKKTMRRQPLPTYAKAGTTVSEFNGTRDEANLRIQSKDHHISDNQPIRVASLSEERETQGFANNTACAIRSYKEIKSHGLRDILLAAGA
jgi:hypothetical protein